MAAGDSFVRPLILLPSERAMWRLTSAEIGLPSEPSSRHCLMYANL